MKRLGKQTEKTVRPSKVGYYAITVFAWIVALLLMMSLVITIVFEVLTAALPYCYMTLYKSLGMVAAPSPVNLIALWIIPTVFIAILFLIGCLKLFRFIWNGMISLIRKVQNKYRKKCGMV